MLPIFRGLTPLQIAGVARCAERVTYTPGAFIIEENSVGEAAIVIIDGTAVRVSGPELASPSEPVVVGSLLGEAAMLVETTYGSTVVARTPVRAVHIARDALYELMLEDPSIADQLVQNLAKRLADVAEVLREVDTLLGGEIAAVAANTQTATTAPSAAALPAPTP